MCIMISEHFYRLGIRIVMVALLFFWRCVQAHQGSYFLPHPSKVLATSTFVKVLNVERHLECAFACLGASGCVSFNLATKPSQGRYLCQLLPRDESSRQLMSSDRFNHYDRFVMSPCISSPCQNGGKCDVIAHGNNFRCSCSPEFIGKRCETVQWMKLNSVPACFGTRDNQFATFTIPNTGQLHTIKLTHRSGQITCDTSNAKGFNNWGCCDFSGDPIYMSTIITDSRNSIKFPHTDYFINDRSKAYKFPGWNAKSPELIYPKLPVPLAVISGQSYRIWFLQEISESNNGGTMCVDVFGFYV